MAVCRRLLYGIEVTCFNGMCIKLLLLVQRIFNESLCAMLFHHLQLCRA